MGIWSAFLELVRVALFAASHVFGGNLGLGIIGLSIGTRLLFLPFGLRAARRAMAMREKMAAIEPELRSIRARYASNWRKMGEETDRAYQRAGIHPVRDAGFSGLLYQMPVGIALYSVIRSAAAGGVSFAWITNLARPDIWVSLIAAAVTFLVGVTIPTQNSSSSQLLPAFIMSALTLLLVIKLSAGVALYWASSSGAGLLQNAFLARRRQ